MRKKFKNVILKLQMLTFYMFYLHRGQLGYPRELLFPIKGWLLIRNGVLVSFLLQKILF